MIIYDLRCENYHKFEGWFKDRQAYEEQKGQKLISCPVCGNSNVEIVPSSVTIMGRDVRMSGKKDARELSIPKAVKMLQEYIEKNFDDVGPRFAEVALRIHRGEEQERNIRGTTTASEEETLRDEGVQFFKIPFPRFDS